MNRRRRPAPSPDYRLPGPATSRPRPDRRRGWPPRRRTAADRCAPSRPPHRPDQGIAGCRPGSADRTRRRRSRRARRWNWPGTASPPWKQRRDRPRAPCCPRRRGPRGGRRMLRRHDRDRDAESDDCGRYQGNRRDARWVAHPVVAGGRSSRAAAGRGEDGASRRHPGSSASRNRQRRPRRRRSRPAPGRRCRRRRRSPIQGASRRPVRQCHQELRAIHSAAPTSASEHRWRSRAVRTRRSTRPAARRCRPRPASPRRPCRHRVPLRSH